MESQKNRIYVCIDLKCFFASVECVERNLDPSQVNLVVADPSRGKGALCLAISPHMKSIGVKNRCRLFEIPENIEYITALPRMNKYMAYSAEIYSIYLKYISKDDIHVYSIDEVFIDITDYMKLYQMTSTQIAKMLIDDVYNTLGITATVGIGTNMYLAKIAMDIIAKHVDSHMASLNEEMYKKYLWNYTPLTDFWQIGPGIARRLALKFNVYDMQGLAHVNEKRLYKEFGVTAQYLIDHAWGKEPTTIADIKAYQPKSNSISNSQVLFEDYTYEEALLVLKEMVELNVIDLVSKHLVTNHVSMYIGYSKDEVSPTGGSKKIGVRTNSLQILNENFIDIFTKTTHKDYLIRRIGISFNDVMDEVYEYYDLFTDLDQIQDERNLNIAISQIKGNYGKNAVVKGMNLLDKATTIKRNTLVGGHNAE